MLLFHCTQYIHQDRLLMCMNKTCVLLKDVYTFSTSLSYITHHFSSFQIYQVFQYATYITKMHTYPTFCFFLALVMWHTWWSIIQPIWTVSGTHTPCWPLLLQLTADKIRGGISCVGISCRLLVRMLKKPVWGLLYPLKDTLPFLGKVLHSHFSLTLLNQWLYLRIFPALQYFYRKNPSACYGAILNF